MSLRKFWKDVYKRQLLSGQLEDRNAAMNIRKTYETRIVEKETVGFRLLGDS